jgi:hypothetical protein
VKSIHILHLSFLLNHDYVGEPGWIVEWLNKLSLQHPVDFGFGAYRSVSVQRMLDDYPTDFDDVQGRPHKEILVVIHA